MVWFFLILGILLFAALLISFITFVIGFLPAYKNHKSSKDTVYLHTHFAKELEESRAFTDALPARRVQITAPDGVTLHASYIPAEGVSRVLASRGLAVVVHGYRGRSGTYEMTISMGWFHKMGYDLLVPDLRGSGESQAKNIGFAIQDRFDVAQWCRFADAEFHPTNIFLYGISMGAATILMASVEELPATVRGVIADCGFTSVQEEFRKLIRGYHLPVQPILLFISLWTKLFCGFTLWEADTRELLKKATIPTLFIHGEKDSYVPSYMSEQAYAACAAPKELFLVPDAVHGASFLTAPEEYGARVSAFLDRWENKE